MHGQFSTRSSVVSSCEPLTYILSRDTHDAICSAFNPAMTYDLVGIFIDAPYGTRSRIPGSCLFLRGPSCQCTPPVSSRLHNEVRVDARREVLLSPCALPVTSFHFLVCASFISHALFPCCPALADQIAAEESFFLKLLIIRHNATDIGGDIE